MPTILPFLLMLVFFILSFFVVKLKRYKYFYLAPLGIALLFIYWSFSSDNHYRELLFAMFGIGASFNSYKQYHKSLQE